MHHEEYIKKDVPEMPPDVGRGEPGLQEVVYEVPKKEIPPPPNITPGQIDAFNRNKQKKQEEEKERKRRETWH